MTAAKPAPTEMNGEPKCAPPSHAQRAAGVGDHPRQPHHALPHGEGWQVSEVHVHQPQPPRLVRGPDRHVAERSE